jgi:hypothetical protein
VHPCTGFRGVGSVSRAGTQEMHNREWLCDVLLASLCTPVPHDSCTHVQPAVWPPMPVTVLHCTPYHGATQAQGVGMCRTCQVSVLCSLLLMLMCTG